MDENLNQPQISPIPESSEPQLSSGHEAGKKLSKYLILVFVIAGIAVAGYFNIPEIGTWLGYFEDEMGSGDQTWQTYRNEEFGFEVKYPEDWKLSTRIDFYKKVRQIYFSNFDFDVEKQYFAYPEENGQLFSIFIDDSSLYQSFLEKNKNSIIDNSPAVRSEVKAGGIIYIEESEVVASGILTHTRIETVKNNLYYLLEISPRSESSIANFDQILSTFKFTK